MSPLLVRDLAVMALLLIVVLVVFAILRATQPDGRKRR
jgi:hypothetical protein